MVWDHLSGVSNTMPAHCRRIMFISFWYNVDNKWLFQATGRMPPFLCVMARLCADTQARHGTLFSTACRCYRTRHSATGNALAFAVQRQFAKQLLCKPIQEKRCCRPVLIRILVMWFNIGLFGYGDTGDTATRRFKCCTDSAWACNIDSEVFSIIDPGNEQVRLTFFENRS